MDSTGPYMAMPRVIPPMVRTQFVVPGVTRTGGAYNRYRGAKNPNAPELKYFDTALNFSFDATGEVPATGQLSLIPQGDTATTRDGRQATIKSVQIRARLDFVPAAGATAQTTTTMYLVLDKQCNGAAAAVTDVFVQNALTVAMLNLDNSDRFIILKKWSHTWGATAGATTAYNNSVKRIEWYKKCNIPITWNSTTGAITEIRSNNIFLLAGADANGDDLVTLTGNCRLRFLG